MNPVYIGTAAHGSPVISPENATIQTVAWATDNEEVATVNAAGVVTAVAQGECNITATTADGRIHRNNSYNRPRARIAGIR